MPLTLASRSPQRRAILEQLGVRFDVVVPEVEETSEGDPRGMVVENALRKARAVAGELVLGADTTVVVDGQIIAKPSDEEDARRMLRLLSGRWHEVLTGVALVRAESGHALVAHERTRVRFAATSEDEIDWHVRTGDVLDKAGAYAIQGRAALFIEAIDGDYWNVVGLPVRLVYELARGLEE